MNNNISKNNFPLNIDFDISQIMKSIAIVFVIFTHLPHDFHALSLNGYGGLGVSTFLFLSGFGLEKSFISHNFNNTGFWIKRLTKTYFPYIITMIIQIAILFLIGKFQMRLLVLPSFLGLYANNTIDPSMWYITYLFIWYLIFFVSTFFKSYFALRAFLFSICTGIVYYMSLLPMFTNGGAELYFLFFPIGIIFANLQLSSCYIRKWIVYLFVIVYTFLWLGFKYLSLLGIIPYILSDVLYLFAPFCLFGLAEIINCFWIRSLFLLIGKYSFYIYLFEFFAIRIGFEFFPEMIYQITNIKQFSSWFSLFLTFLIIFLFSILLKKICKIIGITKKKQ